MVDKKDKDTNFVELEGFRCEINDRKREVTVLHYQQNLSLEIDKYISDNTVYENALTDTKKNYVEGLNHNIKLAPFVLGWLKSPGHDEKLVIAGIITMAEFKKRKKSKLSKK